ncbi:MAG: DUF2062 domain-containing protein [Opitutae bacterium]|nr:DUF2062 domain-containing protein [Opitutae bacterium]
MRRLHGWGVSRQKLRGGFLHSKLGDRILERELWFPTRESLARAWLVGMTVTVIPFLPAQTLIACAIGFLFRANLPVCFALQYLSNPATAVVQLPACYLIGRLLVGASLSETWQQIRLHPGDALISGQAIWSLYLGAIVLGPLLGGLGYGLTHLIWREEPRPAGAPTKVLKAEESDKSSREG